VTGTFFGPCDPVVLADAVRTFDPRTIDPADCRATAERFGAECFRAELARIVADTVREERPARGGERGASRGLAGVPSRRQARRNGVAV
jgi:hypothetical protein